MGIKEINDLELEPQNLEAEKKYLSCIFRDIDEINNTKVIAKHFYNKLHQQIFQTLLEKKTNDITVISNEIGNNDYLLEIATEFIVNKQEYEDIILEKAYKRYINKKIRTLKGLIYSNKDISLIQELLTELSKIETNKNTNSFGVGDLLLDTVDDMFELKDIIKTGFTNLDNILGGIYPGSLNIIAGRPGSGKSFTMMNMGLEISKKDKICFFSFEMTETQITKNIISNKISGLKGKDKDKVMENLGDSGIDIDIMNKFKIYPTNPDLSNILNIIKQENKLGTRVFFIDYLQLMSGLKGKNNQNRNLEIGDITGRLKSIALELNIIIFLGSQLGRAVENRMDKRPLLSDLRDSGNIEQDADVVLMLYREKYYDEDCGDNEDLLDIIVRKNRRGKNGTSSHKYDFAKMKLYQ